MEIDDSDEKKLIQVIKQHGLLEESNRSSEQEKNRRLENIFNKDVVTPEIQESLLCAENLGITQMKIFVDRRLCQSPESDRHLDLKFPIKKNKAKTFVFVV